MGVVRRLALAAAAPLLLTAGLAAVHATPAATAGPAVAASGATTGGVADTQHGGYKVVAFCDVNAGTPHEAAILELAAMGLAGGRPGGTCPS